MIQSSRVSQPAKQSVRAGGKQASTSTINKLHIFIYFFFIFSPNNNILYSSYLNITGTGITYYYFVFVTWLLNFH